MDDVISSLKQKYKNANNRSFSTENRLTEDTTRISENRIALRRTILEHDAQEPNMSLVHNDDAWDLAEQALDDHRNLDVLLAYGRETPVEVIELTGESLSRAAGVKFDITMSTEDAVEKSQTGIWNSIKRFFKAIKDKLVAGLRWLGKKIGLVSKENNETLKDLSKTLEEITEDPNAQKALNTVLATTTNVVNQVGIEEIAKTAANKSSEVGSEFNDDDSDGDSNNQQGNNKKSGFMKMAQVAKAKFNSAMGNPEYEGAPEAVKNAIDSAVAEGLGFLGHVFSYRNIIMYSQLTQVRGQNKMLQQNNQSSSPSSELNRIVNDIVRDYQHTIGDINNLVAEYNKVTQSYSKMKDKDIDSPSAYKQGPNGQTNQTDYLENNHDNKYAQITNTGTNHGGVKMDIKPYNRGNSNSTKTPEITITLSLPDLHVGQLLSANAISNNRISIKGLKHELSHKVYSYTHMNIKTVSDTNHNSQPLETRYISVLYGQIEFKVKGDYTIENGDGTTVQDLATEIMAKYNETLESLAQKPNNNKEINSNALYANTMDKFPNIMKQIYNINFSPTYLTDAGKLTGFINQLSAISQKLATDDQTIIAEQSRITGLIDSVESGIDKLIVQFQEKKNNSSNSDGKGGPFYQFKQFVYLNKLIIKLLFGNIKSVLKFIGHALENVQTHHRVLNVIITNLQQYVAFLGKKFVTDRGMIFGYHHTTGKNALAAKLGQPVSGSGKKYAQTASQSNGNITGTNFNDDSADAAPAPNDGIYN